MSNAQALVLEYLESVWNQGDAKAFEALTTPDFVYYLGGQPTRGRSEMMQFLEMVRSAFPDWRVEVVECIADNNRVAVRWRGEVTHLGAFHGIPPSGKRISVSGINIYHVVNGKITAEWEQMDSLGMLGQIGMPPPAVQ
jgi:steroid delta-isomerase-like uncharacterized protein